MLCSVTIKENRSKSKEEIAWLLQLEKVVVYSWFIHNCQNLKATKMTVSRWVDKQTVEYPDNGLLISTKNDLLTSHEKKKNKLWKGIAEPMLNASY